MSQRLQRVITFAPAFACGGSPAALASVSRGQQASMQDLSISRRRFFSAATLSFAFFRTLLAGMENSFGGLVGSVPQCCGDVVGVIVHPLDERLALGQCLGKLDNRHGRSLCRFADRFSLRG